jgi:hypothetical protein
MSGYRKSECLRITGSTQRASNLLRFEETVSAKCAANSWSRLRNTALRANRDFEILAGNEGIQHQSSVDPGPLLLLDRLQGYLHDIDRLDIQPGLLGAGIEVDLTERARRGNHLCSSFHSLLHPPALERV